jgi:putative oxidoreductase
MSTRLLRTYADLGPLALRLAVGAIFLYHGIDKWKLWGAAGEGMMEPLATLMQILSIIEPLAGIALLLGLFTSYAAIVLGIVMVGAIWFKINIFDTGFVGSKGAGWEFDIVLLAACIALAVWGGGKYAMDGGKKR